MKLKFLIISLLLLKTYNLIASKSKPILNKKNLSKDDQNQNKKKDKKNSKENKKKDKTTKKNNNKKIFNIDTLNPPQTKIAKKKP